MAIARDANSNGRASATTVTVAHTCTGSNLALFTYVYSEDATDDITVTYNGVSMTNLLSDHFVADGTWHYIFGLLAPATGTNNIVVTSGASATNFKSASSESYTGVKQSGLPDSSPAGTNSAAANALTITFTTVANNSWVFLGAEGAVQTAGTGLSQIRFDTTGASLGIYDNNTNGAITPAGSYTATVNYTGNGHVNLLGVSFAPSVAAATKYYRALMGVGTI